MSRLVVKMLAVGDRAKLRELGDRQSQHSIKNKPFGLLVVNLEQVIEGLILFLLDCALYIYLKNDFLIHLQNEVWRENSILIRKVE